MPILNIQTGSNSASESQNLAPEVRGVPRSLNQVCSQQARLPHSSWGAADSVRAGQRHGCSVGPPRKSDSGASCDGECGREHPDEAHVLTQTRTFECKSKDKPCSKFIEDCLNVSKLCKTNNLVSYL